MSNDLEAYLGRDINEVQKELEGKGYTVYIAQDGKETPTTTDDGSADEKRIVLHRGVQDPNKVVTVFEGNRAAALQEIFICKKRVYKHPKLDDPQKYMGRNVSEVAKELKEQNYTVHLVRVGPQATGYVPLAGDDEKRIVLTYDANNEDKVINIREGINDGEWLSDHANMQWRP